MRYKLTTAIIATATSSTTRHRQAARLTDPVCSAPSAMTAMRLSCCRKLQREMYELLLTPVNNPQIDARCDFAYFISNPVGDERSLRVVEHNALFLIQPALVLVNLGHDCLVPHGQDLVLQLAFYAVEH